MIDNIGNIELALQMRDQLHGFYSIIKAADEHLRFVMLTGVSKFAKVSIFSGLNNLKDISLNPDYGSVCGYTEEDLKGTFAEYLQGVDRKRLRRCTTAITFSAPIQSTTPTTSSTSLTAARALANSVRA